MRTAPYIQSIWDTSGPFIGPDGKPHTRVTVQTPWGFLSGDHASDILIAANTGMGNWARGLPLRWFQDINNGQPELEVPNVKSVSIDRSIDQDAGSCSIEIYNQHMFPNAAVPAGATELGEPGYYTPTRGDSPDSQARWGQSVNAWNNLLVPDAIIRTYQGYGGHSKSITTAIVDGNLILTGVWFVDDITINTSGIISVKARDSMKLLIEQQLYPPLVPSDHYPLKYYRYITNMVNINAQGSTQTGGIAVGDKFTAFAGSEVDAWYPGGGVGVGSPGDYIGAGGFPLHGHIGAEAFDGDPATFWLGVGNAVPDAAFSFDWLQANVGEAINGVHVNPYGGNYQMYVSVLESGQWQGGATIPYDPSYLFGTQPYAVDTGAAIPYVAQFSVPWETPQDYLLPRVYNAQAVRITFTSLMATQWGPNIYRAGVREFRAKVVDPLGGNVVSGGTTITTGPIFYAADTIRNPTNINAKGYVTVSSTNQIDAFGDVTLQPYSGGDPPCSHSINGIALTRTGNGYWTLCNLGHVTCYGAAAFYGSPFGTGIPSGNNMASAIVRTSSGNGYWVVTWDGHIFNYGDASSFTGAAPAASEVIMGATAHPLTQGLILLSSNGVTTSYGTATDYGDYNQTAVGNAATGGTELATDIQYTIDGTGYWILTTAGRIQAFGSAALQGGPTPNVSTSPYARYYQLMPAPTDLGYLLQFGSGAVNQFGAVTPFGSPVPGTQAQIRTDGNYQDFSDIIKDLVLWAGFWLEGSGNPTVFGNIESTGAFSEEPLPDEMFDKRPVIDPITRIKEQVGYLCWVGDGGEFHFESPNYFARGNFDEVGNHVTNVVEIDERRQLTDYSINMSDENLRSLIIISSANIDLTQGPSPSSTITTSVTPRTAINLRGLVKPAMWVNGLFATSIQQKLMAELISLHIWFSQRLGQVSCVANPCIQINDQVRIYERQTSESFLHYVRGVNTTHDLDAGTYMQTLTTHWLGTGDSWVVTADSRYATDPTYFVMSDLMKEWLNKVQAKNGITSGGSTPVTFLAPGSPNPGGGAGP